MNKKEAQKEYIVQKFIANQTIMRKSIRLAFEKFYETGKYYYLVSTLKLAARAVGIEKVLRMTKKYFKKGDYTKMVKSKEFQEFLDFLK